MSSPSLSREENLFDFFHHAVGHAVGKHLQNLLVYKLLAIIRGRRRPPPARPPA